ncbi:unnamed protein product [Anisakis simplex]|uniref:Uncharacterized protein n=2 Tax=Anisakis simplex TaxID=6269 RepID=A0A0M3KGF4_ANISI|nr:unnamed protein product [Anisakis simplex]
MSSRSANIGTQNCNNLLPFVCEQGVKPYEDPPLWRTGVIVTAAVLGALVAVIVLLALCWCRKSRKRVEEEMNRKEFIRTSLRLTKMEKQRRDNELWSRTQVSGIYSLSDFFQFSTQDSPHSDTDDVISRAHRNMIQGNNNAAWSPTETVRTSCSNLIDHSPVRQSSNLIIPTNDPKSMTRTSAQLVNPGPPAPPSSGSPTCSDRSTTCSASSCITSTSGFTPMSVRSSTVSERTILARPLIPHASVTQPLISAEESRRPRPMSTGTYVDYFATAVPHRPAPPPPTQPQTTPSITAETVFPVNPPPSQPQPPLTNGVHPSPKTEAMMFTQRQTPTSQAAYRSRMRPSAAPPVPPAGSSGDAHFIKNAQTNSRSLVDLVNPHMQQQQEIGPRRNSTGRFMAPLETSM